MTLNRSLAAAPLCALPCLAADGLDPAALLRPPTDTWPTYNGDYSGRRYSPLSQINQSNVSRTVPDFVPSLHQKWVHFVAIRGSTPLNLPFGYS